MADERTPRVVYVAYTTFNTALDTLKEGIPPQIDRTVFRNQSGGTQAQLMAAFKALGLVNESSEPNRPVLERLVNPSTRKATLKEVLQDKYRAFVQLAADRGTEQQYTDQFRQMGVGGDTLQKAMGFFQNAAVDVGIPISPYVLKKAKSATGEAAVRKVRRPRSKKTRDETPAVPPVTPNINQGLTVTLKSGGTLTVAVTADFLAMTAADRKFVFELIDKVSGYDKDGPTHEREPAKGVVDPVK